MLNAGGQRTLLLAIVVFLAALGLFHLVLG